VVNELVKQLVAILRYIAAPAMGGLLAWLFDDNHDIVRIAAQAAWPWSTPPSIWPSLGFLALTGLAVYFAHRTLFHHLVTKWLVGRHTKDLKPKPTIDDLAFARWKRRGAADHTAEKSTQVVLDETNAAIHFFYCSGWSAVFIALFFKSAFPSDFHLIGPIWHFALTVLAFLVIALVGDNRTAKLDLEAFIRHK